MIHLIVLETYKFSLHINQNSFRIEADTMDKSVMICFAFVMLFQPVVLVTSFPWNSYIVNISTWLYFLLHVLMTLKQHFIYLIETCYLPLLHVRVFVLFQCEIKIWKVCFGRFSSHLQFLDGHFRALNITTVIYIWYQRRRGDRG